ncbi:MAG: hypothetical protein JF609_03120 [Verrucomicrobia bacterium]|nr:hypothetical protein [Verrucomicrobiota bacterium]
MHLLLHPQFAARCIVVIKPKRKPQPNSILGVHYNCMSQSTKPSSLLLCLAITATVVCLLVFIIIPGRIKEPRTSPANACINNMREIDAAKNKWMSEHNARTNDVVTLDDIKPYLVPYGEPNGYIKLDAHGNLPKCPLGGIYTIGKIGESPTCSLSNMVNPQHVVP